jgi:maleylpyruvate isomerase
MDGATAATGTRDAHERLMRALDDVHFDDAMARGDSALPGWSRGHVLTHLARNADSNTRMIEAAKIGSPVAQYPGGMEQRASEIEAGAGRSAAALLDDVRSADDALADAYAGVDEETWQRNALRWGTETWPVLDLPFLRWREVAVHTVDLGLPAIGIDIWAASYVEHELRRQLAALPARLPGPMGMRLVPGDDNWSTVVMRVADGDPQGFVTIEATTHELLAWTIGRLQGESHWPPLTPWQGIP